MSKRKNVVSGPGWKVQWQRFTKEDARRALAKFKEDRALNESWAAALTQTMNLGLWDTFNPSQVPVAFDREGNRLNGKHRLAAFLASNLSEIVFPVVTGLSPEAFGKFDVDARLRQHTAAHAGRAYVTRDEARINWLEALVSANPNVKVTTSVFGHLADGKWAKQIAWADEVLPRTGGQCKAPYASALMYVHRADPAFADKFGKAWSNGGVGLPAQALRFRDVAVSGRTEGGRSGRIGQTMKLLHILACMHQGKPLPERIIENLNGLRYWSQRLGDGAAKRWEKIATVSASAEE